MTHLCTVCCQVIAQDDVTTTLYNVTYHARCAGVVRAAEKEAERERQTEN